MYEMRTYSRKQAGVVYRAIKEGKLEMDKNLISKMYDYVGKVEVYGTNDLSYKENFACAIQNIVTAIFENNYKSAQASINNLAAA